MTAKKLAYLVTLLFMRVYTLWLRSGRTLIFTDATDTTPLHFSRCCTGVILVIEPSVALYGIVYESMLSSVKSPMEFKLYGSTSRALTAQRPTMPFLLQPPTDSAFAEQRCLLFSLAGLEPSCCITHSCRLNSFSPAFQVLMLLSAPLEHLLD